MVHSADWFSNETKLTASDGAANDRFGSSVSISGDVAIVGASGNDDNGTDSGSAYTFARKEGGTDNWGEVTKLPASDAVSTALFGFSVSISGDLAIVGAVGNDDYGSSSGSAYIFARNEGGANNWGEVTKLTASDAVSLALFGFSVSISGDVAIVGAYWNHGSGSAYILPALLSPLPADGNDFRKCLQTGFHQIFCDMMLN